MRNPSWLRTGWWAAGFDVAAACATMVLAYRLRFDFPTATHFLLAGLLPLGGIVFLQIQLGVLTGLYRLGGLVMWPVRLIAASVGGAGLGLGLSFALGVEDGVSRQAVASQAALLALVGALWRSAVGLRVRRWQQRQIRDQYGHEELVELGADISTMTGGVVRAWDYRHLLVNLVTKELKLKYQRSVLGFAWSLVNPLIMIAVYTVAFTYIIRMGTERFAQFILIGLLAWNFFAGSVGAATDAVVGNSQLLKTVVFPRVVLPFSTVAFHLVQFLLTLLVFLPATLVVYGVPPAPRMLLFPIFLVLQATFMAGLTLLLATAATMFRDVKHLVEVGVGILFWTTPIIYEPTMVPERFQQLTLLSPMVSFVRAYQDLFYYGVMPDLSIWIVATVYAVGMFVCGLSVFLAYEDRFAEYV